MRLLGSAARAVWALRSVGLKAPSLKLLVSNVKSMLRVISVMSESKISVRFAETRINDLHPLNPRFEHLSHRGGGIFRPEHGGARNNNLCSGIDYLPDVIQIDAAVDLDPHRQPT